MATFPSIDPDFGFNKQSEPNNKTVRFADGYEQRILFGLPENQNAKTYQLTFSNITETDSDTIEAFLNSRADDQQSFDFTPPGESASSKFVCEKWSKTVPHANYATIRATFRQVFEP